MGAWSEALALGMKDSKACIVEGAPWAWVMGQMWVRRRGGSRMWYCFSPREWGDVSFRATGNQDFRWPRIAMPDHKLFVINVKRNNNISGTNLKCHDHWTFYEYPRSACYSRYKGKK